MILGYARLAKRLGLSMKITTIGSDWLQAKAAGGTWLQDTAAALVTSNSDWFSGHKGASPADLAANSFATIQQLSTTNRNSIAVNTGIARLAKQLVNKKV
jgi:hypothetical protein